MHRILILFIAFLSFHIAVAQTPFDAIMLNGEVKMSEGLYEPALKYYRQAREVADTEAQREYATKKIIECQRKIDATAQNKTTSGRKIKTDRYFENGDEFLFPEQKIKPGPGTYEGSVYEISVYEDRMIILAHYDMKTNEECDFIPAGMEIIISERNDIFSKYTSEDNAVSFIVFRAASKNQFGTYNIILRQVADKYYKLYSSPETKLMEKQEAERSSSPVAEEKTVPEQEHAPVIFSQHWALNLDSAGKKIGDSRKCDSLFLAKDICWLMVRFKYESPENFEKKVEFHIKIWSPSNKLLTIAGDRPQKGYSMSQFCDIHPGGGIMNVTIGDDQAGTLKSGDYRFEIWHQNILYYTANVTLR